MFMFNCTCYMGHILPEDRLRLQSLDPLHRSKRRREPTGSGVMREGRRGLVGREAG